MLFSVITLINSSISLLFIILNTAYIIEILLNRCDKYKNIVFILAWIHMSLILSYDRCQSLIIYFCTNAMQVASDTHPLCMSIYLKLETNLKLHL